MENNKETCNNAQTTRTEAVAATAEITAQDVINALNNPTDTLCIRVLDDRKLGIFKGLNYSCEAGKFATLEPDLRKHNALNREVGFVVNTGGHKDADITRINAQFVEMDNVSFEEQQKKIDAFPLAPSMIIKTRRSFHVYWFVKDAKVSLFRAIQKKLIEHFDGDPNCVNESRVMRLPGFNHCKQEPIMVRCVSFHPERRYTQAQLAEIFPDIQKEEVPTVTRKGSEAGIGIVMRRCDFLKHCKDNAKTLSEFDWYAMITNVAPFEGGTELIHELSKPYPGYNANQTQNKINHFLDSKTGPIKCQTIAEKGFKCPKLASGECNCKSPAALCHKPLSPTGLQEELDTISVTGRPLDDMVSIREFIKTCLYNQDRIMAETFINHNIKEKFKLNSADLKPLLTYYKDCAKKYQTGLEHRKARAESDIFYPWYRASEHGIQFMPGVLAEELAKRENVIYAAQQHYCYDTGVYKQLDEIKVLRKVQQKMIPSETKKQQIIDAEYQWRLHMGIDLRELNPNPFIINVKNGLYNVLEDTLLPHDPHYYSTVQVAANYNKDAKCPLFLKFLENSMCGDMDQVKLIQEVLGYVLIPVQSAQKSFLMVGAAGAGKSVLLRTISDILLGSQNVSNVPWQALNDRFKTAELFGKLANIFADLPTKNIDDNGIFKALVGEDNLTVEKKNKDPFSFQSYARLIFSCNNIPKNYGDRSEGFYRRLIIIRFNKAVPVAERDPHLLDKFRAEADGIFMFALEGLRRLIQQQYKFSETQVNVDELQQYREDSDSVLSFVRDCCVVASDGTGEVLSTELYKAYEQYCKDSGITSHYSIKHFVQQIVSYYSTVSKGRDNVTRLHTLNGIKLREEAF